MEHFRKAHARNMLKMFETVHLEQLVQCLGCVLVAVLVHVQSRHSEFRLRCVGTVPVLAIELGGRRFRGLQIAAGHVLREVVVKCRCGNFRIDLLRLVVIDPEQDGRAERDAANHVQAVVRPPRTHLVNLFFFRK